MMYLRENLNNEFIICNKSIIFITIVSIYKDLLTFLYSLFRIRVINFFFSKMNMIYMYSLFETK
jgi:hypothetical protein